MPKTSVLPTPNSFSTPSIIAERLMSHLEDIELRAVVYLNWRTLGFWKRQDRVALSQFAFGIKDADGNVIDEGAGLSVDSARKALRSLVAFGIVRIVKPHSATESLPPEYELNLDGEIDFSALYARSEAKRAKQDKTNRRLSELAQARKAGNELLKSHTLPGSHPPTPSPVHNPPPSPVRNRGTVLNINTKDISNTEIKEETAAAVSGASSPKPKKSEKTTAPKTTRVRTTTEEQAKILAVKAAYAKAVREGLPGIVAGYEIDWAREHKGAAALVKAGWLPDQVTAYYREVKAQNFWRTNHLSLATILKNIGAYHASKQQPSVGAENSEAQIAGVASRTQRPANAFRLEDAAAF